MPFAGLDAMLTEFILARIRCGCLIECDGRLFRNGWASIFDLLESFGPGQGRPHAGADAFRELAGADYGQVARRLRKDFKKVAMEAEFLQSFTKAAIEGALLNLWASTDVSMGRVMNAIPAWWMSSMALSNPK
jgi:hypothetical protein